jgi:hypothetical protein
MNSPNFSALMDPAQLGVSVRNAFQMGMDRRRETETNQALYDYSKNQSPESAANISRFDPRMGMQVQQFEQQRQADLLKQQQAEHEKQVVAAALGGDPEARKELAYYNSELYLKLDERSKKSYDQVMGAVAQQAFHILQLPPEQQGPALQQAIQGFHQQGLDTSGIQLSGDPTQDLMSALAITGHLDEWEQFAQPKYSPVGEGGLAGFQFGQPIQQNGQPQNFGPGQPQAAQGGQMQPRFTQAITADQFRAAFANIPGPAAADAAAKAGAAVKVSSPDEARQLPSGTWIVLPDNTYGRVP